MNYWRIGTVKVETEEGSNCLSSKEVTMATGPQPTSRHLSTRHWKRKIPVCGIDICPKMWEGRRKKQSSKLTEQSSIKTHGNTLRELTALALF